MISKTITYVGYDDVERTETFYFNLTKTELAIMNNSVAGSLQSAIEKMAGSHDIPEVMSLFVNIIKSAYGEKSPDGRRFMKSEEIWKNFSETPAYDALFLELTQDTNSMIAFIKGILPNDLAGAVTLNPSLTSGDTTKIIPVAPSTNTVQ